MCTGPRAGRRRDERQRQAAVCKLRPHRQSRAVPGAHLLTQWFPAGRVRGHEFCIGNLRGDPGKSLRVNLQTGQWADFAGSSDERGGDLISLFAALHGMKQVDAARALAMELGADATPPAGAKVVALPEWRAIMPVPADAPSPPAEHFRLGTPSHIAEVRGVDGALLHYIYRFDPNGRRKE